MLVMHRKLYDLCMGFNGMPVHNVLNTCGVVGGGMLLNCPVLFINICLKNRQRLILKYGFLQRCKCIVNHWSFYQLFVL